MRLAKRGAQGSKASKQQNVIIHKLCLANEGDTMSDEALQAYVQLFETPLSDAHIEAILAFFGWHPAILPVIAEEALGDVVQ